MERIGRYEVEAELGRGAMGVVYLAHDPRVRRRLAVKTYLLPPGLEPAREREYQERFLREAQTAGGLDHPAIVTIYDAGEDPRAGGPYIAMEYVRGRNLREELAERGRLPAAEVASLGCALADALHVAHAAGIVHRDVKPANILIRAEDRAAKIADFGVARPPSSHLTRSGQSIGSPAYMSPEQVRGQEVDGRSDLFSLAVVLYEALTGRRPFQGEDPASLGYAVAHEPAAPVTTLVPGLAAAADSFFATALAKRPADRFADGRALAASLGRALSAGAAAAATAASSLPMAGQAAATVVDGVSRGEATMAASGLLETLLPGAATRWSARLRLLLGALGKAGTVALAALGPLPRAGAAAGARWCRAAGARFAGLSPRARRGLGVAALIVLAIGAALLLLLEPPALVTLQVKNSFESGTLYVAVDGETVYAGRLEADRRQVKAFGKKLMEWGNQEFEQTLRLSPGSRRIEVRVEPEGEPAIAQALTAELASGDRRRLKLTMGRRGRDPLEMRLN